MDISQNYKRLKLFSSTKILIDKTKNGENVPSIEIVEVVLVQCNLVENQYQQKPDLLYTFTPNKSYVYLLYVGPSNLVYLQTYNIEFDEIIITSIDQNGRPLEIEDQVNLTLLINKQKWYVILQNTEQENILKKIYYIILTNIKSKRKYIILTNMKSNSWVQE